jgi:hypothetical protein
MRASLKALSCLAVAAAVSVSSADTILRQKTLADLTKASSTSYFTRHNCDFVSATTDSSGSPIASFKFRGTYASFGQDLSSSQDWSSYNMVQAMLTNKETHAVHFKFIVQLSSDPNSYSNAYTGSLYLDPGESKLYIFNLNPDSSKPYGMEYLRPVLTAPYSEVIAGSTFRNLRTIYHWRISNQDSSNATLAISQIKLLKQNVVFDDIADAYGQYTDRGWTAKIHQDSDFAALKADEMSDLSAHPGTGEMNGSKSLVSPNKTIGAWKVVRNSSGQMYLQHPNGKLFWSLGVSGVGEGAATPTEGRSNLFASLPSTSGKYAGAYMSRPTPDGDLTCLSFNVKNLMTKYGTNYAPAWESMVKQRLASWGVNTLGIQSKSDFLGGSIPYTLVEDTGDFKTRLRTPHMLWGSMPDPYTDGFQTWLTEKFTTDLATDMTHQNFMGVFVDNEMSWGSTDTTDLYYNVPRGTLNSPSSQPAKIALMNQLKNSYKSSISSLNSAWGTSYSSWTDFLSKQWIPKSYSSSMKTDFSKFIAGTADQYYYKVNAALTAAGLKSLYLGSRFDDYTPEVVAAASKYVDVLSFNMYRTVDNVDWNYLNGLTKPVMISELGYGTKARGTFGGPATTFSVQERSARLAEFLGKAITQKNIVGVHWYSYVDQPITGRWSDYENTGMGLVDVADNPYPETVQVLRDFTKNMYANRS